MQFRLFFFGCVLALFYSSTAFAAPGFKASFGEGYDVAFVDGSPTAKTPASNYGISMGIPLSDTLSWSVGLSAITPRTLFTPNPRIATSIGYKVNDSLTIGLGPYFQYNFGYGGKAATYKTALDLSFATPITKEIGISLTATGGLFEDGTTFVAFAPKINFKLPF